MLQKMLICACATGLLLGPGCDVIDQDNILKSNPTEPVSQRDGTVRKVLLEYFTGHYCGNCPSSSKPAFEAIENLYGENVVVMTIHAGAFAIPSALPDNLDLRSEAGNFIYNQAGISNVPSGMINRSAYNGSASLSPLVWTTAIGEVIEDRAAFELEIDNEYIDGSNAGTVTASIKKVGLTSENYSIGAYILEDSIVGYQLDYYTTDYPDQKIPDYVFHDVLRGSISATEGASLSADSSLVRTFSYTLDLSWVERHCSVVIVITNDVTEEVVQCGTIDVIFAQ